MSTRKRSDDDFDREVRAHIEIETERLIDEGMAPDAARVAARRRFGNVTARSRTLLRSQAPPVGRSLLQDLRCAARNMRRYPVVIARRGPVARRRHRRDDGHADDPRRHLPQAAAALPAPRAALEDPDRLAREPDHALRQWHPGRPLPRLAGNGRDRRWRRIRRCGRTRDSDRRLYRQRHAPRGHARALRRHRRSAIAWRSFSRLDRQRRPARDPQPSRVAAALRPADRRDRPRFLDR